MTIIHQGLTPHTKFNPAEVRAHINAFRETGIELGITQNMLNNSKNAARPVLIVCPGPSARKKMPDGRTKLQHLVEEKKTTHNIVLANGAVSFLKDETISADDINGIVISSPGAGPNKILDSVDQVGEAPIYIATLSKPEVFSFFENANLVPWNAYIGDNDSYGDDDIAIGTGWGAAVAIASLMSALGHRKFEAVGWDGYEDKALPLADGSDMSHHYTHGSTFVEIDGTHYELLKEFGGDVPEIIDLTTAHPDAITELYLHGDGPTAKMLNQNDGPRTDFSNIKVFKPADYDGGMHNNSTFGHNK